MAQRNRAQKKRIQAQARAGALTHAWLVTGGTPESREELAAFIAAALICPDREAPCGGCSHCLKLAKGVHPDLIRLEFLPDKSGYVVEQAREIVRDAYIMPNEAPRKVYLIPAADEMNINAQNALLKTLEEPPARSAFILMTANSAALLETVRSRCAELLAEGEDGPGDEDKYARAVFDSFLRSSPMDIASACLMLEKAKLDRDGFNGVLDSLSMLLALKIRGEQDSAQRERLFTAKEEVEELLRRRVSNNTGAGHTAGALAVRLGRLCSLSGKS